MREYDIAVVGAGPAGSVFAREVLRVCKELKVAVINGQTRESAKVCGGLLAPDAQKVLARFGLTLPTSVLDDPQIFAVETVDAERLAWVKQQYTTADEEQRHSGAAQAAPEQSGQPATAKIWQLKSRTAEVNDQHAADRHSLA